MTRTFSTLNFRNLLGYENGDYYHAVVNKTGTWNIYFVQDRAHDIIDEGGSGRSFTRYETDKDLINKNLSFDKMLDLMEEYETAYATDIVLGRDVSHTRISEEEREKVENFLLFNPALIRDKKHYSHASHIEREMRVRAHETDIRETFQSYAYPLKSKKYGRHTKLWFEMRKNQDSTWDVIMMRESPRKLVFINEENLYVGKNMTFSDARIAALRLESAAKMRFISNELKGSAKDRDVKEAIRRADKFYPAPKNRM